MLSVIMLNIIVLNAVILNAIMLNVVMLNVIMLNVIMLNVVMLYVVILNVVAPFGILNNRLIFVDIFAQCYKTFFTVIHSIYDKLERLILSDVLALL